MNYRALLSGMTTEPKRGRGRPEIGPEVRGVRLDPDDLAEVEAWAAEDRVPRAEMLRAIFRSGVAVERRRRKRS